MTFFISIQLQGGLGNQFFQIFTAAAEAIRSNRKLVCTHIDAKRQTYNGLYFTVPTEPKGLQFQQVEETKEFHVQEFPQNCNIRLHGYFQKKEYFDTLFEASCALIHFKMPIVTKKQGTGIHIRRSDYLQALFLYDVLDENYYKFQIQNCERPYMIYTEDPRDPVTQQIAKTLGAEIQSSSKDFESLMSYNSLILANSTYSWWAAYLAKKVRPHESFTIKVPPFMISKKHGLPFLDL